ncbi:hypothetical protein JCM10213v2_002697 [Rhodosporidiobolus nylandii]
MASSAAEHGKASTHKSHHQSKTETRKGGKVETVKKRVSSAYIFYQNAVRGTVKAELTKQLGRPAILSQPYYEMVTAAKLARGMAVEEHEQQEALKGDQHGTRQQKRRRAAIGNQVPTKLTLATLLDLPDEARRDGLLIAGQDRMPSTTYKLDPSAFGPTSLLDDPAIHRDQFGDIFGASPLVHDEHIARLGSVNLSGPGTAGLTGLEALVTIISRSASMVWHLFSIAPALGNLLRSPWMIEWARQVGVKLTIICHDNQLKHVQKYIDDADSLYMHAKPDTALSRDRTTVFDLDGSFNLSEIGSTVGRDESGLSFDYISIEIHRLRLLPVGSVELQEFSNKFDKHLQELAQQHRLRSVSSAPAAPSKPAYVTQNPPVTTSGSFGDPSGVFGPGEKLERYWTLDQKQRQRRSELSLKGEEDKRAAEVQLLLSPAGRPTYLKCHIETDGQPRAHITVYCLYKFAPDAGSARSVEFSQLAISQQRTPLPRDNNVAAAIRRAFALPVSSVSTLDRKKQTLQGRTRVSWQPDGRWRVQFDWPQTQTTVQWSYSLSEQDTWSAETSPFTRSGHHFVAAAVSSIRTYLEQKGQPDLPPEDVQPQGTSADRPGSGKEGLKETDDDRELSE